MGKIRLGCDVDGVLLDQGKLLLPYMQEAIQKISQKEKREVIPEVKSIEDITKYDLPYYGISLEEMKEMFRNFEFTGQFLNMDAVLGAVEGIKKLSQKGYLIDIITARTDYELVEFDTIFNLGKIGIIQKREYQRIFCEPDKYKIIKPNHIKLMFEDRPQAIYELSDEGIYCACIAQPWNKEVEKFARDNPLVERLSWQEAVDWVDEVNEKFKD
jgi:uncharacterized HAD superfamily protein